jgi:hypothetical protein
MPEKNEKKAHMVGDSKSYELGYFGNIWVRSHSLEKMGDINGGGHLHAFDHVTMLHNGKVLVETTNPETGEQRSKEFTAPTFMVIRKNLKHKITALTDSVQYYCVFALRDIDGEVTDVYSGANDPYGVVDDDHWIKKKLEKLDKSTTHDHD